ncbi:MAG TPA: tyrosine-type recombinase/integrase [Ktedonobacterales bacterium]|nr:tyrosine-type recombinase/integrase [Ktedonobacterales bacterium]
MNGSTADDRRQHQLDVGMAQPSLFDLEPPRLLTTPAAEPLARPPALTARSPLSACQVPYQGYLRATDRTANTITCFLSDLGHFIGFLGSARPIGEITLNDLERWRQHLKARGGHRGGIAPAPKTIARRMTFLKNFFGWLAHEGILPSDPSERLAFVRPVPPLPELLFEDEVARLQDAARAEVRGELLVLVLLAAGLKREEVLGLRPQDIDLTDPAHPALEVHFPRQNKRGRERRMALPADFAAVYARYSAKFRPVERVFDCTPRNLSYALAAAVRRARLQRPVTLQLLRDIYAVRQLRAGVSMEALREKLGLSEDAWPEASEKYRRLATTL